MTREEVIKELSMLKMTVLDSDFNFSTVHAVNIAIEALRNVPDTNVGKWIPCSERLPNHEGLVWVTVENPDGTRFADYDLFGLDDEKWTIFNFTGKVVAWMPLPEPYKGVKNK